MKKGLITIIILVIVGLFIFLYFQGMFNKMVKKDENVQKKWADVETYYKRRADLIPNLINTVKGAANFEQSTLKMVIEARAKATSVTINADNLSPENIQKFQAAQEGVSSALNKLLAVVENYPDMKTSKNFLELQAQLEGTENRIAVARNDFNEAVNSYNSYIRRFPQNLFAGMYGFEKKGYFKAAPGDENSPKVEF